MNIMNSPDAGTTAHDLNTNISSKRLSIIMCPPSMLAKRRIVSAKGLVKSPMNSTGANISIMGFGTPGIDTISFQYSFVPLNYTITNVNAASVRVNDVLPETFAPNGKKGISPQRLVNSIKKNSVRR